MNAYPITPKPADDSRFTFELTYDVGLVLAEHGYPPVTDGDDHVSLSLALYRFLYGGAE